MNLEEKLNKEFEEQAKALTKTNIMVVGGTGVGKSSLINNIFGDQVAQVGAGKPVTKGVNKIEHQDLPITIFDTEGYEIIDGTIDNSNFEKEVISEIKRRKALELKDQIHLFWYCISVGNHRITSYDLKNIQKLNELGLSLAIVFTQCDTEAIDENDNGLTSMAFREVLESNDIKNPCFETISTDEADNLQTNDLIEWSAKNLDSKELREAFIGSQKLNISLKDTAAKKAIALASAAAATAAGANPIPLSDSVLIMPIQIGLAITLARTYGFNSLGGHVMSLLKTQVVSLIGRQTAAGITKLIPGVGQLINAGVALSLTGAMGFALQTLYKSAYIEYLETGKEPSWVELFKDLDLSAFLKVASKEKQV